MPFVLAVMPCRLTPPKALCVNHASCRPVVSGKCDVCIVAVGRSLMNNIIMQCIVDTAGNDACLSLPKCNVHGYS